VDATRFESGADAMQPTPRVVFIHGVNGRKKFKKWLGPLNESLRNAGIGAIDRAEVPEVRYRHHLGRKRDRNGQRTRVIATDAAVKAAYAANQDELLRLLRDYRRSSKSRLTDAPKPIRRHGAWIIRKWPPFRDAERYRRRRERVCAEVVKSMGPGEFIVIGHSLGSVVAADLLTRLESDQHVRLLITVGSPLGAGDWSRTWRTLTPFPFGKLDAWVNVYNPSDVVTGGVGLRQRTRRVIDIPIKPFAKTRSLHGQHRIGPYVSHPAVATAIRWAVRPTPRPRKEEVRS
jgi:pimeloyl-ACP methyl ester carboxylesterase